VRQGGRAEGGGGGGGMMHAALHKGALLLAAVAVAVREGRCGASAGQTRAGRASGWDSVTQRWEGVGVGGGGGGVKVHAALDMAALLLAAVAVRE
jgi:hypothetical protein